MVTRGRGATRYGSSVREEGDRRAVTEGEGTWIGKGLPPQQRERERQMREGERDSRCSENRQKRKKWVRESMSGQLRREREEGEGRRERGAALMSE
jgi:hypothetical protein